MTEQEKANDGPKKWSPMTRLLIENPISAFNAAAIIIGGAGVYYSNQARMDAVEARVARIEQSMKEDATAANVKDDRTAQRIEAISNKLNTVEITTARTDERVAHIIRQLQDIIRQPPARGPQ